MDHIKNALTKNKNTKIAHGFSSKKIQKRSQTLQKGPISALLSF
jgi:hypothetical protein